MHYRYKALSLLPLAMAVSAAFAADDGYQTLDTSVVSASGYAQDTRDAPASISVVTDKDLSTRPVADIGEAIQDVPGVDIEQTKMGGHTIRLRGFESKYTLILIDGKRQNPDDGFFKNGMDPTGSLMPSPAAIERIEVLRGPASVVYGSDAVGGVVNIITKKNPGKFTGSVGVEGTLQQHDDQYGNNWATNTYLSIPLIQDTMTLQLRGRYYQQSAAGLKNPGGGYAGHSPSEGFTGSIGGRLNYTVNEANNFYIDGDFFRFKGGSMSTTSGSIKSLWFANKENLTIAHEGNYDFGRTDTYFQLSNLEKTGDVALESATYVLGSKLVKPMDFGGWGSMMLSTGIEVMYSTFLDDSPGKQRNFENAPSVYLKTDTTGNRLHQTQISGFAEGEYFINDQWSTTIGARYTWGDIFGGEITPRAYLVYKPVDAFSIKGGVSRGYKVPALKELMDGAYEINNQPDTAYPRFGNPDLKPEESWNYELSANWRLGHLLDMTLTGFHTDFKNKIDYEDFDYVPPGATDPANQTIGAERRINIGKVRARGVEFLLQTGKFNGFSLSSGYTYTDSRVASGERNGQPLSSLPRHVVTARVDYTNQDFNAFLRMRAKYDTPNVSSRGTPAFEKYKNYRVFDLGLNYTLLKNHKFAFTVNNLFDEEFYDWIAVRGKNNRITSSNMYRDYLYGRNFWFSYTYAF